MDEGARDAKYPAKKRKKEKQAISTESSERAIWLLAKRLGALKQSTAACSLQRLQLPDPVLPLAVAEPPAGDSNSGSGSSFDQRPRTKTKPKPISTRDILCVSSCVFFLFLFFCLRGCS
jgi:hypothetical protein